MKNDSSETDVLGIRASRVFLTTLDRAAQKRFTSKSDYVRQAVVERFEREGILNQSADVTAPAMSDPPR